MSELFEMPAASRNDPGGMQLAAVLSAKRRAEEWVARRVLVGRIVIVLSLPMAHLLLRGSGTGHPAARFVLALWILAFGCLVGCTMAAARAERLLYARLNRAGSRRIRMDD